MRGVGDSTLMKGVKGPAEGHRVQSRLQPLRRLSAPLQVTALGSAGVSLAHLVVRGVSVGGRRARVTPSGWFVERRRRRQSGPGQEPGSVSVSSDNRSRAGCVTARKNVAQVIHGRPRTESWGQRALKVSDLTTACRRRRAARSRSTLSVGVRPPHLTQSVRRTREVMS